MLEINGYECNNSAECGAIRRIVVPEGQGKSLSTFPMKCENCDSDDITPIAIQRLDVANGD